MMKQRLLSLATGFLTAAAVTTAAQAEPINHAEQYEACIRLVNQRPDAAFESALSWASQGGGYPAEHCASQALFALEIYDAAGTRLEKLAQDMQTDDSELRSQILHQAGRAWFLHGDLDRAYAVQSAAIELYPQGVDYYIDRAEILAELGRYSEALADLDAAVTLAPERADLYALRATTHRYLGDNEAAMAAAERSLQLAPDNLEALLERGILRRLAGDDEGAREDWLRVVNLGLGTPAADAAQINLEKLDVTVE